MKLIRVTILLVVFAIAPHASAEIYKYVDEHGRITYTNVPKKGAKKLDVEAGGGTKARASVGNAGPATFPKRVLRSLV